MQNRALAALESAQSNAAAAAASLTEQYLIAFCWYSKHHVQEVGCIRQIVPGVHKRLACIVQQLVECQSMLEAFLPSLIR